MSLKPIILQRIGVTLEVGGKKITVRRVLGVTESHIIVEHLDGRVEAIPLTAVKGFSVQNRAVAVPA